MKLLFTGASGFLGSNIRPILQKEYDISTVGITDMDDYSVDISKNIPELKEYFDIVLHAAGKAHVVPKTEAEKQTFFDINYQGTIHLCQALEKSGVPKAFIFISSVAVYGCESGENITEDHPLNGCTPYAVSKRQAEEYLQEWCHKHNVILSILRPSLIAGPNPPGNLGTMIKGIETGKYFCIGGGKARKSVLMVEDIARLVPLVAEKGGIYNVCDDSQPTFRQLEKIISRQLHKPLPYNIPYWFAQCIALTGDCMGSKAPFNSSKLRKITKSLTFSNEKAKQELDWAPLNVTEYFKIY